MGAFSYQGTFTGAGSVILTIPDYISKIGVTLTPGMGENMQVNATTDYPVESGSTWTEIADTGNGDTYVVADVVSGIQIESSGAGTYSIVGKAI